MLVRCHHCGSKSIITKSEVISNFETSLNCVCRNTEGCGASFVYMVSFKHWIKEPASTHFELVKQLVEKLTPEQREQIKTLLFS